MAAGSPAPFPTIDKCLSENRKTHVVVSDLDGTLFRGRSSFPYFALVAYESGGVLRLLLLLLLTPLAGLLYHFGSESAGIQVLIFASLAGVRLASIDSIARAVLPKFYAADLHPDTWRVFSACGRRCVLTENPRVMVEPFLKEFLGADEVVGTELCSYKGWATGLVRRPGVLVGKKKAAALVKVLCLESPEIGIGDRRTDFPFLSLCKEGYVVEPRRGVEAVRREELPKPVIFHDGRLVEKPTPFFALCTVLWIPIGFVLSCVRVAATFLLPMRHARLALSILGVRFVVRGAPTPLSNGSSGVLFICNHRTVLDVVALSVVLGRPVAAVTYSVSRLTEFLSPIKAARLTRHRAKDAAIMGGLLREGDLAICPEGTTCREPYLLRFSALFAELTDEIVPVALVNTMSMFHGTTARGWKGMDIFYFLMNPRPSYEVIFLRKLPMEMTCGAGGRKSHEVANYVQREIAAQLGCQCTQLTRKDKYLALAGNDGRLEAKPADLRRRNVG